MYFLQVIVAIGAEFVNGSLTEFAVIFVDVAIAKGQKMKSQKNEKENSRHSEFSLPGPPSS